jgi:hypothetical protein
MRHPTLHVLAALLLTSLLPACSDEASPPGTGFIRVQDDRGHAWTWLEDPSLRVVLYNTPDVPGLLIERGDRSLSFVADWGLGPKQLPVLLVTPRSDGTDPLAADDSPGLHLLLAGSAEHGCPADDLELDLVPRWDGDELILDIRISGILYLALPTEGLVTVADDLGVVQIEAQQVCQQQASQEFEGFRWLRYEGHQLGVIDLHAAQPMPWFQVQGHSQLVELDMDHACEAADPMLRADLTMIARL